MKEMPHSHVLSYVSLYAGQQYLLANVCDILTYTPLAPERIPKASDKGASIYQEATNQSIKSDHFFGTSYLIS